MTGKRKGDGDSARDGAPGGAATTPAWRVAPTVLQKPADGGLESADTAVATDRDLDPSKLESADTAIATDRDLDPSKLESADTAVASDAALAPGPASPQGPDTEPMDSPGRRGFCAGDRFDKFQVLDRLGAGGMGVVYAAFDPDLDRRVAIKVLRSDVGGPAASARLLREAKAMAQLTHPSVITVHQVGTLDDQIFMVMEYVDGGTLRDWIEAQERTWREVLEVMLAAGRGLAAAHAAGLVHRDFKPDNVLMHSDGRVLVTDFGLVGTAADAARGDEADEALGSSGAGLSSSGIGSSGLDIALTRTGEVMGTPLYMAPEQHRGQRADARADQFAFCVALYEALYRARPFAGDSYREVAESVLRGELRPPPAKTPVPAWIQAVVARGLSVRRSQRHPAMAELLAALDRDPAAKRQRRWLVGAAAAAVLGVAGVVYAVWPEDPGARCSAAGVPPGGLLGESWRARLGAAWAKDKKGAARVLTGLERYGAAWARERVSACEATHVKGEQSEQLLDRRVLCLDRRRAALNALVDALLTKGAKVSPFAAMVAVTRLPRLEECRDREALAEVVPPPAGSREPIKAVMAEIERADAAFKVGEREAARRGVEQALKRARAIGYGPLTAQAHYLAGFLTARSADHKAAKEHYQQAIRLAAAAKAHRLEAIAWLGLIYYVGHVTGHPEPALTMAPAAEAAVARAAGDPALRGRLDGNVGLILLSKGDYRAARKRLEASLSAFVKARGLDDLDTAVARNNLALVLEKLGQHEAAYAQLERALAARATVLGPDHYDVATALNDLGNTAHSLGKLKQARRQLERALAIRQAVLGADHARTGQTLNNLAIVLGDLGQHALAAKHARRAVQVAERAHGKNHADVAAPLNTLGNQLRDLGQQRLAWEAYARGMAVIEFTKGKDNIDVTPMVENLARILMKLGDLKRALEFVDRALAIRLKVQGPRHPATLNAAALRGSLNLEGQRPAEAVKDFERQRVLAARAHGPLHAEVAQAEYNMAVALEQAGEPARAEAQYRRALATFERSAPSHRVVVSAWRGLGDVASARKDLAAAQRHYERAVAAAKAAGRAAPAAVLQLLGGVHARRGRHTRAVAALDQARKALEARKGGDPAQLALAELALARALWDGRLDRARAIKLARHARRLFVTAGTRAADNVKEVDAWLKGKR